MEQVLFSPLFDFYSVELQSQYVTGLPYRVTAKNFERVNQWVADSLVKFVDRPVAAAVSGKGEV
jgi:hypothetical protein